MATDKAGKSGRPEKTDSDAEATQKRAAKSQKDAGSEQVEPAPSEVAINVANVQSDDDDEKETKR